MISKGSWNAGLSTVQDKTLREQMVLEQEDALKIKTVEEKIILSLDFEFFIGVSAVHHISQNNIDTAEIFFFN